MTPVLISDTKIYSLLLLFPEVNNKEWRIHDIFLGFVTTRSDNRSIGGMIDYSILCNKEFRIISYTTTINSKVILDQKLSC